MTDTERVDGRDLFHKPIEKGWGNVHMNRFRIHFLTEDRCLLPHFPNTIFDTFEQVFSGTAPRTLQNIVSATKHTGDRLGEYIQFDLRLKLDLDHLAGQFRDDWVKVGWKDRTRGFAVETMGYATNILKGAVVFNVTPIRHHFLCGRRSWVIFKLREWVDLDMPSQKYLSPSKLSIRTDQEHKVQKDEIYVLETAAIERFSGLSINVRNQMSNGIKDMIINIWSTHLENFVKFHNLRVICPLDKFTFPPYQLEQKRIGNVYYQSSEFESATDCKSNNVAFQIRNWHPYLGDMNLDYDLIKEY